MTIYEKIAKIQDEVEVRKDADNPFFHSRYATYEGLLNCVHDSMRKHELVAFHTFEPTPKDGYIVVVTVLQELSSYMVNKDITREINPTSVGRIESKLEIPLLKNDPQSAGSAITYAKRYSLLAILGLGTEDDDGNVSSGKTVPTNFSKPIPGDVMDDAMVGSKCKKCGAGMHKSMKGNWVCDEACWTK